MEEIFGLAYTAHPPTCLQEECRVKMMRERLGQENNLEPMERLQAIPEFQILHIPRGLGEYLVEGICPQSFGRQGDVAGIEVKPSWGLPGEQGAVGKLNSAFIEPTHKRRDG